ncbi:uncharacterized protein C12orf71 homolog isoform X2 [Talpa occidentalis]|uniref:uncharacterized protein C12orf71 homolog isoform X2 n=1 Tax=Talpa occidentalis TaxID=50954 RepID=UPI00188FF580|nr:uncharacterized protein C12orf71 homolog isoform X2 [Talpa occidentalis]
MAHSSSRSNPTDMEDCSSESNLSLSVGHFPCEDISYENTISYEDTSSEGPLILPFVPPIQGTWWTEGAGRLVGKRDQVQDSPEQFCKLSISLAWDIDVGAHHADPIAHLDQIRDTQWVEKHPNRGTQLTLSKLHNLVQKLDRFLENLKDEEDDVSVFPESALEEDSQLSSSSLPDMVQTSHQEHNVCQDLSNLNPLEKEEVMQPPQRFSWLQEQELVVRSSQATGNRRTSIRESSLSSGQLEREDAQGHTQTGSCLNFRLQALEGLQASGLSSFLPKILTQCLLSLY